MIRLLTFLACLSFVLQPSISQVRIDTVIINNNGVEKILVEVNAPTSAAITAGVPANVLTYRIFVDLEPTYKLLGFSGLDNITPPIPLTITSSQAFYNPVNTGSTCLDVNVGFWSYFPNLEYDSYASDGRVGSDSVGILKSLDPDGNGYMAITAATTPILDVVLGLPHPIFTDNTTTSFSELNGGWGIGQVVGPTADNIIFVGQLTTSGDLSFITNISVQDVYLNIRKAKEIYYPDLDPPTVSIINPVDGATYLLGSTISLEATASYQKGIGSVDFYVNNVQIERDYTEPFQVNWTPATNGSYTLKTIANDADFFNTDIDSIQINIANVAPPSISITMPNNNQVFFTSDPVLIEADARDTDGNIDSVEFYINGIKKSIEKLAVTGYSYQYTWYAQTGKAQIIAIAYDNNGITNSDTINITIVAPSTPNPVLSNPLAGDTIISGDVVLINATVTDNDNDVDSVEFFINDNKIGVDTSAPYTCNWQSSGSGTTTIKITVRDARGLSKSESIGVYLKMNEAPVVAIKSPVDGAEITPGVSLTLSTVAFDAEGVIDSVEFFINDVKVGLDTIASNDSIYSINWTAIEGSVVIKAVATDNRGLSSEFDSISILVIDNNLAPEISISSPVDSSEFLVGAIIDIVANATDTDGTIDSVIFMLNSSVLTVVKTSPYTYQWKSVLGAYTLKAIATDNDGATRESRVRMVISDISGFHSKEFNNLVAMYPNPVNDLLTIKLAVELLETAEKIFLYSMTGTLVSSTDLSIDREDGLYQINVKGLKEGMYFIVISGSDFYLSSRLIKQ